MMRPTLVSANFVGEASFQTSRRSLPTISQSKSNTANMFASEERLRTETSAGSLINLILNAPNNPPNRLTVGMLSSSGSEAPPETKSMARFTRYTNRVHKWPISSHQHFQNHHGRTCETAHAAWFQDQLYECGLA